MLIVIACAIVMSGEYVPKKQVSNRMSACVEVATRAKLAKLDPLLLMSISWIESRFDRRAVSNAGAVGLLQILPKYFCPRRKLKNCDTIDAGLKAWVIWRKTVKSDREALCRYNGGWRCGRRSRHYARAVIRTRQKVTASRLWQIAYRFHTICADMFFWGDRWRN